MSTDTKLQSWLTGRLPKDWFEGAPEVTLDREEITIVGHLSAPELPEDSSDADRAAGVAGRIKGFREDTRDQRITIAREIEHRTGRKVSWGVAIDERRELFTTMSVPVMTRLKQSERTVLDTLVDSGVAKSRSEALAWCVRLVGKNTDEWLGKLREAMSDVATLREQGPA